MLPQHRKQRIRDGARHRYSTAHQNTERPPLGHNPSLFHSLNHRTTDSLLPQPASLRTSQVALVNGGESPLQRLFGGVRPLRAMPPTRTRRSSRSILVAVDLVSHECLCLCALSFQAGGSGLELPGGDTAGVQLVELGIGSSGGLRRGKSKNPASAYANRIRHAVVHRDSDGKGTGVIVCLTPDAPLGRRSRCQRTSGLVAQQRDMPS
jgi:hypothetical protein